MAKRIPDMWKNTVSAILQKGLTDQLQVTARAKMNFEELFPGTFTYDMLDAFIDALANPNLQGDRVYGMKPEGETYEFIFAYRRLPVYGKMCLRKDGRLVVIFSAHRPLKGNKL